MTNLHKSRTIRRFSINSDLFSNYEAIKGTLNENVFFSDYFWNKFCTENRCRELRFKTVGFSSCSIRHRIEANFAEAFPNGSLSIAVNDEKFLIQRPSNFPLGVKQRLVWLYWKWSFFNSRLWRSSTWFRLSRRIRRSSLHWLRSKGNFEPFDWIYKKMLSDWWSFGSCQHGL